jgi:hypothetical protein
LGREQLIDHFRALERGEAEERDHPVRVTVMEALYQGQ